MAIDLRCGQVHKHQNMIYLIFLYHFAMRKSFKFFGRLSQFFCIAQVKMSTHQIVHGFDVVSRFNIIHVGIFSEKVYPFLSITIVLQKVLSDKGIPAISLVQVKTFIKTLCILCFFGQIIFQKFFQFFDFFCASRMSMCYVPPI